MELLFLILNQKTFGLGGQCQDLGHWMKGCILFRHLAVIV